MIEQKRKSKEQRGGKKVRTTEDCWVPKSKRMRSGGKQTLISK